MPARRKQRAAECSPFPSCLMRARKEQSKKWWEQWEQDYPVSLQALYIKG
jgi:hypothetical protein